MPRFPLAADNTEGFDYLRPAGVDILRGLGRVNGIAHFLRSDAEDLQKPRQHLSPPIAFNRYQPNGDERQDFEYCLIDRHFSFLLVRYFANSPVSARQGVESCHDRSQPRLDRPVHDGFKFNSIDVIALY